MLIEHSELSEVALYGVAQQYICSNMSDVDSDLDMELWTRQVISAIKKGELLIDYSEHNESIYLRKREELPDEIEGE